MLIPRKTSIQKPLRVTGSQNSRNRNRELSSTTLNRSGMNSGLILLLSSTIGNLERIWYENQYFLACCLRPNKVAPGLFANWSAGDIGTSWHGDYHADYNCEQVYWGVFSSNHVEQHLPFVELCENLLPIATKFAAEHFGLPGAMFPVSSYPAPSQIVAYPVPPWAYQFGMTPWMVQSLWWQYLYTQDERLSPPCIPNSERGRAIHRCLRKEK